MIEGIIVMTTMLVFIGFIVYTRKSYGMKLDLQQQTRANVLYYASHGCTGGEGSSTEGQGSTDGIREVDAAAEKSSIPNKVAASRRWNTAKSEATGTVNWQAVWDVNPEKGKSGIQLEKHKLSRNISAHSETTCNEKKYGSQWSAWLEFGIDFVSRGFGGVGDLFK